MSLAMRRRVWRQTVKRVRKHYGMSQEDFARLVGVSFSTVNRWERGHTMPPRLYRQKVERMAKRIQAVT